MTTAAQNSKQILAQKGTAGTPSFSFLGGNTSGMYLAGTNQLGFSTAGVNAVTIDSSGNVGIGTASPDANLSVFGSTAVAADVGGEISIGGFYNGSSKTSYGSIAGVNQYGTGNTSGQLLFKTRTNFGSLTERMRIDSSGSVAIGNSVDNNTRVLNFTTSGGGSSSIQSVTVGATNQALTFSTTYATLGERMRITGDGNVGIGTTSPAQKLQVAGSVFLSSGNNTAISWSSDLSSHYLKYNSTLDGLIMQGYGGLAFYTAGANERMRIDSSGNVGIGTSSISTKLDVRSGSTSINTLGVNSSLTTAYSATGYNGATARILITGGGASGAANGIEFTQGGASELFFGQVQESGGAGAFVFQGYSGSAYSERMRIDSSGNVGIGNSTPSSFNSSANKLVVGTGSGNNGITIYSGSASQAGIYFGYGTTGAQAYAGQFIYNHANNSFSTYVSGTTLATTIDSSGNLLVGTTSAGTSVFITQSSTLDLMAGYNGATKKFTVSNTGQIYAVFTSISSISDITQKENVRDIPYGLSTVLDLKPKQFDFKAEMGGEKGLLGFIAQDVEAVIPELVKPNEDGLKTLKMGDILPVLVAAIQELSAKNDALEARLAKLENV